MYLPQFAEVMCKNAILSKDTAGQTQYFERILHFQREMCGKRWDFKMQFSHWPFNKNNFWRSPDNPERESFPTMYSNIGVSVCETVPLIQTNFAHFADSHRLTDCAAEKYCQLTEISTRGNCIRPRDYLRKKRKPQLPVERPTWGPEASRRSQA